MLQLGLAYARRDRLSNVHFARAQVEALPFRPATFDAAICGGALHLFPDTVAALRQIARALQPGAPLAVTTFIAGDGGILKYRRVREHIHAEHRMHIFELPELQGYLAEAGFTGFEPRLFGSFVVFRAVRA
jgi:ubiquinone/menaquinone biosynthesis C-methylase UbiE